MAALGAFIGRAAAATPGAAAVTPTATVTGEVTVNGFSYSGGKLPFGSLVDLVHGTITMKTGVGTVRASGVGRITAAFVLLFTHVDGEPYVELRLAEGNFSVCPKRTTSGTSSASAKVIRALWGSGMGNFQTSGRFAAATVRGTHWLTDDRCDGTWTDVARGVVDMTSFRTGKTVAVHQGHTFLVFS